VCHGWHQLQTYMSVKNAYLLSDVKGKIVRVSHLVLAVLNVLKTCTFVDVWYKASAGDIPNF
jgi:hypothetical protein